MRLFRAAVALLVIAGMAWAVQGKPINETCPVKGQPVKGVTTTYKGKTIGFC